MPSETTLCTDQFFRCSLMSEKWLVDCGLISGLESGQELVPVRWCPGIHSSALQSNTLHWWPTNLAIK